MGLMYHGHTFDTLPTCICCNDAVKATLSDPTGTRPIRTRFRMTTRIKWQQLRSIVREMLVKQDLLMLKAGGLLSTNVQMYSGASKVSAFQAWFDQALSRIVLETNGSYMRPFIMDGYREGQAFGQSVVDAAFVNLNAQGRVDLISQLATVEMQGIIEAVSQQSVRAVANGLLHNSRPLDIVREIWRVVDKIGITRTNQMIGMLVVKAYGDATLDVYAATGITEVGLIPEARDAVLMMDAVKKTRTKKKTITKAERLRAGAGTRSSRKNTPSASTIARITSQEANLERLGSVYIRTAEDEDVCPICLKLAKGGPYKIDKARSLIPAHPNCRCVFVPANDNRFREVKQRAARKRKTRDGFVIDVNKGNPNHDPHNGQFSSGHGDFGGMGKAALDPGYVKGDAKGNADKMKALLEARGHKATIVKDGSKGVMSYDTETRGMLINVDHPYWRDPVAGQAHAFKTKQASTSHVMHVLHHEEGHALYVAKYKYADGSAAEHKRYSARVTKLLSKYGGTDPTEMAAEVHAAHMAGRKLHSDIETIFRNHTKRRT
jgi:hypothetical protein